MLGVDIATYQPYYHQMQGIITIENEILILLSAMEISFYEAGNLVLVVGDVCT